MLYLHNHKCDKGNSSLLFQGHVSCPCAKLFLFQQFHCISDTVKKKTSTQIYQYLLTTSPWKLSLTSCLGGRPLNKKVKGDYFKQYRLERGAPPPWGSTCPPYPSPLPETLTPCAPVLSLPLLDTLSSGIGCSLLRALRSLLLLPASSLLASTTPSLSGTLDVLLLLSAPPSSVLFPSPLDLPQIM